MGQETANGVFLFAKGGETDDKYSGSNAQNIDYG